jgi:hypothetical protein
MRNPTHHSRKWKGFGSQYYDHFFPKKVQSSYWWGQNMKKYRSMGGK